METIYVLTACVEHEGDTAICAYRDKAEAEKWMNIANQYVKDNRANEYKQVFRDMHPLKDFGLYATIGDYYTADELELHG